MTKEKGENKRNGMRRRGGELLTLFLDLGQSLGNQLRGRSFDRKVNCSNIVALAMFKAHI